MYAEIQLHPPKPDQSRYLRPIERTGGELGWRVFLEFHSLKEFTSFTSWWLNNIKSGSIYNSTDVHYEDEFDEDDEFTFAGLIRDKDEAEKFEVDWAILSKLCEENNDE